MSRNQMFKAWRKVALLRRRGRTATFGFNFDKVLASLVDKDGLDTGALGSAIQIYLKENTNVNSPSTVNGTMVLNVFIAYTRHLSMKGGVLSVSG